MRKALVVGINYYQHGSPLFGCVDDAHAVKSALQRHSDGTVNFGVKRKRSLKDVLEVVETKL